jgi:hypothetical protein
MNEDALRALVRDAIARLESRPAAPAPPDPAALVSFQSHPASYRYNLVPTDGPCLIEPAVPCNHCGYCQSHGH